MSSCFCVLAQRLSSVLVGIKYEGMEVEEMPEEPISKAKRGVEIKRTTSYLLRLLGKYETLDEKSLQGIDDRIKRARTEEEKNRLTKIREAYEKLMKA